MYSILILFSLFPTVIFSYNGRPVAYTEVDKSKLTTLQEHEWHVFLQDYPFFRCYAAMQNITLPVDYQVKPHCLKPTNKTFPGRPLFDGDKVNTSKFTEEFENRSHNFLLANPKYRCYAAMANLSLLTDYEVPPGCLVEFKSAFESQLGDTDPTDMSTPSNDYRQNVNESDPQNTVSNDSTLIKYISLSIVVSVMIASIMLIMYDYYRRKYCHNNRSIQKLNKVIIFDKDDTTTL